MERDDYGTHLLRMYKNFNSHAHVERDEIKFDPETGFFDFNSHAHVERDLLRSTVLILI